MSLDNYMIDDVAKAGAVDVAAKNAEFRSIWQGGYFEGDPRSPMSSSSYGVLGYNSVLYTTYLACIKPYVNRESTVLEIGPGRGAWTKCFAALNAKKIWAVDVSPAERTGFWEYVGPSERITYVQADDTSLKEIPDGAIDFFFTFGVFCHLPEQMIESYLQSLLPKLKPGAHAMMMVADYDKMNACLDAIDDTGLFATLGSSPRLMPIRLLWRAMFSLTSPTRMVKLRKDDPNAHATDGKARWYHLGVERACAILEGFGYEVIERDLGVNHRDPVIHFRRRPS
jgi:hypothetical protein